AVISVNNLTTSQPIQRAFGSSRKVNRHTTRADRELQEVELFVRVRVRQPNGPGLVENTMIHLRQVRPIDSSCRLIGLLRYCHQRAAVQDAERLTDAITSNDRTFQRALDRKLECTGVQ